MSAIRPEWAKGHRIVSIHQRLAIGATQDDTTPTLALRGAVRAVEEYLIEWEGMYDAFTTSAAAQVALFTYGGHRILGHVDPATGGFHRFSPWTILQLLRMHGEVKVVVDQPTRPSGRKPHPSPVLSYASALIVAWIAGAVVATVAR